MFGENSRAISTLTQLLQTPYNSWIYPTTYYAGTSQARPALGPVARRSRFPKTLRGKAAVNLRDFGQRLIPTGEQSGLMTHIAATESVSLWDR